MEDIKKNLDMIRGEIAETAQQCGRSADDVLLVAVSKTRTPKEINVAIDAGVTDIGENKVQEIMDKFDEVKPVKWHMIGHLQTNKVKYIIDKVSMIHSVTPISWPQRSTSVPVLRGSRWISCCRSIRHRKKASSVLLQQKRKN